MEVIILKIFRNEIIMMRIIPEKSPIFIKKADEQKHRIQELIGFGLTIDEIRKLENFQLSLQEIKEIFEPGSKVIWQTKYFLSRTAIKFVGNTKNRISKSDIKGSDITGRSITKTGTEEYIIIKDYNNFTVKKGQIFEIVIDIPWIIQFLLRGGTIALTPAITWISSFKWDSKGFIIELTNRILNYSTDIGILKNKISVDPVKTRLSDDFSTLYFRFTILENAWQLAAVIVAILGVVGFLYFSVREVRLISGELPEILERGGSVLAGMSVGAAVAIAVYFILTN